MIKTTSSKIFQHLKCILRVYVIFMRFETHSRRYAKCLIWRSCTRPCLWEVDNYWQHGAVIVALWFILFIWIYLFWHNPCLIDFVSDLACGKRMKGWNINIITKVITYSRPKLVSDVIIKQGHRLFSPPFFFWISWLMIKYFLGGNVIINSSLGLYENFGCKVWTWGSPHVGNSQVVFKVRVQKVATLGDTNQIWSWVYVENEGKRCEYLNNVKEPL